jgi:hypothetical protein
MVAIKLKTKMRSRSAVCAWSGPRLKHVARRGRILLTHQHFEPAAGPCEMGPHATGCIGLDHRVDARCFERTLRQIRFRSIAECV